LILKKQIDLETLNYIKKYVAQVLIFPIWELLDKIVPKKDNYWAFPVHHIKSEQFIENSRAIFEVIKKDSNIKKVIFCRNKQSDFQIQEAENVVYVYNKSAKGLWLLLRCKVVFVTNSISMEYSWRFGPKLFSILKVDLKSHIVVNLSHGISLKRINSISNKLVKNRLERVTYRKKEPLHYSGLLASSEVDSYAMAAMYYPVKYENVWLTGLPRNDFLLKIISELPAYLQIQINLIEELKKGRKLIVYAPTYRQTDAVADSSYYKFSDAEINELKQVLKKHNAVFGFRMHYFRNNNSLFNMEDYIDDEYIFDLGHQKFSDIASVIREADLVISDYSSVFIEAIFLSIPVIGFTYDFENYSEKQNGLLYDFKMIFPGQLTNKFTEVIEKIDNELSLTNQSGKEKYKFSQQFFFKYFDDKNSERVVNKVKSLLKKNQII
jgi:CDP-glycerol glycerophosphotransferase (TagB/SpsB family)